jgi:hypothetical protein
MGVDGRRADRTERGMGVMWFKLEKMGAEGKRAVGATMGGPATGPCARAAETDEAAPFMF